jgi:hypothetical protein
MRHPITLGFALLVAATVGSTASSAPIPDATAVTTRPPPPPVLVPVLYTLYGAVDGRLNAEPDLRPIRPDQWGRRLWKLCGRAVVSGLIGHVRRAALRPSGHDQP